MGFLRLIPKKLFTFVAGNYKIKKKPQKAKHRTPTSERRMIDSAYEEATKLMPWERITKTNHKDVTYYKGLLQEYTRDLLFVMRNDFLEEITGQHIKNKTFEEG